MQEVRDQFGVFKSVSDSEMNVVIGAAVQVRAAYNSGIEVSPGTAKLEWKYRSVIRP